MRGAEHGKLKRDPVSGAILNRRGPVCGVKFVDQYLFVCSVGGGGGRLLGI